MMKFSPKDPTQYTYEDGVLYVNGEPLDFGKILATVQDAIRESAKSAPLSVRHQAHKMGMGSAAMKTAHDSLDIVFCVNKLRAQVSQLNEDLYLKAQMGLIALSAEETLTYVQDHLQIESMSIELDCSPIGNISKRLMVRPFPKMKGVAEKYKLADSIIGPEAPYFSKLKEALLMSLGSQSKLLDNFMKNPVGKKMTVNLDLQTGEIFVERTSYYGAQASNQLNLIPPSKETEMFSLAEVVAASEPHFSSLVTEDQARKHPGLKTNPDLQDGHSRAANNFLAKLGVGGV